MLYNINMVHLISETLSKKFGHNINLYVNDKYNTDLIGVCGYKDYIEPIIENIISEMKNFKYKFSGVTMETYSQNDILHKDIMYIFVKRKDIK